MTGQKFGRLTLVSKDEKKSKATQETHWICLCDCGNESVTRLVQLKSGATKSCGCLRAEPNRRTHGHSSGARVTPEYQSYTNMITRCESPASRYFADYGGRGIRICPRWRESFEAFLADMGPRPVRHSLDRIDVNGSYEPGNCRWATAKQQQRNRRDNRRFLYRGESLSIAEWAERSGIKYDTLRRRIVHGWAPERALTQPVGPSRWTP